jgi:uncharacterized repeat protein (TIGR03806 family)
MRAWLLFCVCLGACESSPSGGDQDLGPPDLAQPVLPAPFGLDARPANPSCVAPDRPPSQGRMVAVERVYTQLGFAVPVDLRQAPGDNSAWYVVEKAGRIRKFPNVANPAPGEVTTYADISARVNNNFGESGLLAMAFHPQFAANKKVFVSYTAYGPYEGAADASGKPINLRSTVSSFVEVGGVLDTGAGKETIYFPPDDSGGTTTRGPTDQPYGNHNGGNIVFGPDGYLYYGLGDGGSGGDPLNAGQDVNLLLGKLLRIDVDNIPGGQRYGIPDGNPFKSGGGRPEIYAWGLRNPWRYSFDRATGELWLGDVGQNTYEEIDLIKVGGNYGWRIREGKHCYSPPNNCPTAGLIEPVVEYSHPGSAQGSVTGGFVYRGKAMPGLVGTYFFADQVNGDLYAITYDVTGAPQATLFLDTMQNVNAFAEDQDGELYFASYGGGIYKIVPAGTPPPDTFPKTLSATGCVEAADATRPAAGLIPYGVNTELWSDGAAKRRWLALPDGAQITVGADGDFDFPNGTVLVKEFSIGGQRVETRLLMRHPDGSWGGYSYEWNDAGTDAALLPAGKAKQVGGQRWTFPSRSECLVCHTVAAGRTLGLELSQQNGEFVYESTLRRSNQLATLDHIGLFAQSPGDPAGLPALSPLGAAGAPVEARARAYLHANCSFCHRPMGTGQGPQDLRFATPLAMAMLCDVNPQAGSLGITNAKLLAPGAPERSILSHRMHSLDANRMPPLATSMVDTAATTVVDDWIRSLAACP